MTQLDLQFAVDDCSALPVTPAEEGPDGSLRSWWLRGAAAKHRGDEWWAAWSVTPVPPGCPAYTAGARWFYAASNRGTTQVGSARSSGPLAGDRETVARHARRVLRTLDEHWRRAREREREYGVCP